MEKKRSESVTILASLALCIGIWDIILQLYNLAGFSMLHSPFLKQYSYPIFMALLFAVLYAFFAYQTLKLRNWARLALVILSFGSVITHIILTLVSSYHVSKGVIFYRLLVSDFPPSLIFVFVAIYLTRPKVKEQFSR